MIVFLNSWLAYDCPETLSRCLSRMLLGTQTQPGTLASRDIVIFSLWEETWVRSSSKVTGFPRSL